MVEHTVPQSEEQARIRLRALISQVEVTNVLTGARIEGAGKNGCIAAAARGAERPSVHVAWNGTSAAEVRRALDELQGES